MSLATFPSLPGLAYPVKKSIDWGGGFKWDALSGKRVRAAIRTAPLYAYDVAFNFLRSDTVFAELQALQGFINSLQGGSGAFLYQDADDNAVVNQGFGEGDGVSTTFQLVRAFGGFAEPVFAPVTPITQVTVAGTPTTAYTVGAYGAITFNSAPANGAQLGWTGSFKWVCRLDQDVFDLSLFMLQLYELKSLKFSTEKLP